MVEQTSKTQSRVAAKVIGITRYVVMLSIAGVFASALVLYLDSFVLACQGVINVLITIGQGGTKDVKSVAIDFIQLADLFFIATAFYVIAVGLYKVFIDETLPLPKAMSCNNFDDLKHLLVKVATVILVILFLEKAIEWQGGWEILGLGAAIALVIGAATWSIQTH